MTQHPISTPLVSVTSVAQLDEISGAARVRLDKDALAELDAASR
jgi:aryl-alcohol dehydrogenase-like predicted oxidoreductase